MLKLVRLLGISGLFMALSATVWADGDNTADNQPAQARIRLYGQNQKPTTMTYHLQNGQKVKIAVGAGMGEAFSSFIGIAKNTSLGIPKTAMISHMKQYNGILSKVFYHEYAIPTHTAITVHNAFIGQSTGDPMSTGARTGSHTVTTYTQPSCDGDDITFTAEAGKDYEVIPTYNSSACGVTVLQVNADGSTQPLSNQ